MTDKEIIVKVAHDLELNRHPWVLAGSGVMVMHGLRDHKPMGDIDIFVPQRIWLEIFGEEGWRVFTTDPYDEKRCCDPPYLYREMYGIEVNVFPDWRVRQYGNFDVAERIHNPVVVDGIPCTSLQFLLEWKLEVKREKDAEDIAVLRKALNR